MVVIRCSCTEGDGPRGFSPRVEYAVGFFKDYLVWMISSDRSANIGVFFGDSGGGEDGAGLPQVIWEV